MNAYSSESRIEPEDAGGLYAVRLRECDRLLFYADSLSEIADRLRDMEMPFDKFMITRVPSADEVEAT